MSVYCEISSQTHNAKRSAFGVSFKPNREKTMCVKFPSKIKQNYQERVSIRINKGDTQHHKIKKVNYIKI